jgi:hypothetical protein
MYHLDVSCMTTCDFEARHSRVFGCSLGFYFGDREAEHACIILMSVA